MRKYILTLNFAAIILFGGNTQLMAQTPLDISGIESWPELHNSVLEWEGGAFSVSIDPSNPYDLSWGVYNPDDHNVYGDSLYIVQFPAPSLEYKQFFLEELVNGMFKFHYADIDGSNAQTIIVDKDDFEGKNFGHFSFYYEDVNHDIEPATADWDIVFTRYNRPVDHYGVAGVLSNKHVLVAEVAEMDTNLVVPADLEYSEEINTIGYDWKYFGASGFEVEEDRSYYLIDETEDTAVVIFHEFSGSGGGGICKFTVNGEMKTIEMGTGYVDRVFYSLQDGIVHTSDRNGWDLAFDGTSFGTNVRTNEEIGIRLWIYPHADKGIWNTAAKLDENATNTVNVFPNPSRNNLNIQTNFDSAFRVELFNELGQLVMGQEVANGNQTQLNIQDLPQ
ncbi:MAG: T9SS type A sorting domain-containing protein, partial [Flavobacteriales bacterium]|nr:T9SS type A sorting domain-containing protein [Flavobacteriales bacterium]